MSQASEILKQAQRDSGGLGVEVMNDLPPVSGRMVCRVVKMSGCVTGSAYTDGDAMGDLITFKNVFREQRLSGWVVGAFIIDVDDEGLAVDLPLFVRKFTVTADDAAFAPSDDDVLSCRAVISISSFSNWGSNQFGQSFGTNVPIVGVDQNLYCQVVARGAINLAVGKEPTVGIVVVPD